MNCRLSPSTLQPHLPPARPLPSGPSITELLAVATDSPCFFKSSALGGRCLSTWNLSPSLSSHTSYFLQSLRLSSSISPSRKPPLTSPAPVPSQMDMAFVFSKDSHSHVLMPSCRISRQYDGQTPLPQSGESVSPPLDLGGGAS